MPRLAFRVVLCSSVYLFLGVAIVFPQGSETGLSFDGTDDRLVIPGYKGITGADDRTVEAWIRGSFSTSVHHIIDWGDNSGFGTRWTLRSGAGHFRAEVRGGFVEGTTLINDNVWHHIAVVFANDGTPNITDALLYVDGVLETVTSGSQSVNTTSGVDVEAGWSPILLGSFIGATLDEVRIWSTARTQMEIVDNMCIELAGSEPGLEVYLQMNEGSGQVAADTTANNRDATLGTDMTVETTDPTWVSTMISNPVCMPFVPVELQSFAVE